jgi:hypothetical protein
MRASFRQAWQQKHPTPSHAGWDFHWHPRELPGAAQAIAQASARGQGKLAVFAISARSVVWLRGFSVVAPAEQRRYVGWSGASAEIDDPLRFAQALPAALFRLALPEPRPFVAGDTASEAEIELCALRQGLPPRCDASLVRAAVFGGEATAADPHDPALPKAVAQLLLWLPPAERTRPRSGVFVAGATAPSLQPGERNLVHYLHRAWQGASSRPWRLVLELCAAERTSLVGLFSELTRVSDAWEDPVALLEYLEISDPGRGPAPLLPAQVGDGGRMWNRVLHYWGRGFLDVEAERLATVLARRIVCDHLLALDAPAGGDPERYLRRLRLESLLRARDVRTLRQALLSRLPSLEVQRERA